MGTKHLTEADRLRARTLFFDAGLPKARICQITGFSLNQVKLAIREKTPKTRSGRPPRRRPGAAVAVAASGVAGETPIGIAQGADGSETLVEHGDHSEHGEDGSMMPVYSTAATPSPAVTETGAASAHHSGDRVPSVHHYGQQQQQQHHHQVQQQQQQQQQHQPQLQHHQQQQQPQQHYQQHGHHPTKWDTDYHSQQPYYSSWTQPAPGSPNSVQGGPRGSSTPASPPLPPPTASMLMHQTVAPLGIPSPYSSAKGRGDIGVGSVGSVGSRDGRSSDGHDFSSSTSSSSLASSATSYSSMASSTSGGGFSLPSILASATGP